MEPPPSGQPPDREPPMGLRSPCITVKALPAPAVEQQQQQQQQQPEETPSKLCSPQQAQMRNNLAALSSLNVACNAGSSSSNGGDRSPALASAATTINAATQAATAFSGSSLGHPHQPHHHHTHHHHQAKGPAGGGGPAAAAAAAAAGGGGGGGLGSAGSHHHHSNHGSETNFQFGGSVSQLPQQQTIEKLSRPMAFDKMEVLVREMQDQEHGVPVRQQKMFLTSIPYAFMGYDLIEWLMDHLQIEESEALNIANQLCLHGYFFPVNDSKTLTVKDDSSLYRFQTPYYWPWQHKAPDNVEYAIYLAKRSLRNKQRHALEDYEAEAFASLHKNLKGKWDFISMQAEEQVRLAKERKKGDKIVGDSQERAYWRVHRPPPGQFTPLEPCPVPSRDRQGQKPNKKKTVEDIQREVEFLSKTLNGTRMKMSQACESLVLYSETFSEYDFFLQPALPSNPWVTEDTAFWQLNSTFVDIPTEKRVKRWAISIEELVSDPTGLQEFTNFLEKEYSHENIRFWIAVNRLRRSAHSQVSRKVNEIFEEFLKPGAPCEINIDGKTMESVLRGLKNPSRFTFDSASEHIYMLLLKKDCYPRFIRSDHYKRLVDTGIQPSHKKRFFNFGAVSGAKKKMTAALSSQPNLGETVTKISSTTTGPPASTAAPPPGNLARRRGSDRSLTGSALELTIIAANKNDGTKVPHSHSQNNLCELPYRESPNTKFVQLETTVDIPPKAAAAAAAAAAASSSVCPWDEPTTTTTTTTTIAPADAATVSPNNVNRAAALPMSAQTTSDDRAEETAKPGPASNLEIGEVAGRMQRNLCIRHQNTVDSGVEATARIAAPTFTEQRRASVSLTHSSVHDYQFGRVSSTSLSSNLPIGGGSLQPLKARGACVGSDSGAAVEGRSSRSEPPTFELPVLAMPAEPLPAPQSTKMITPPPPPPPITTITTTTTSTGAAAAAAAAADADAAASVAAARESEIPLTAVSQEPSPTGMPVNPSERSASVPNPSISAVQPDEQLESDTTVGVVKEIQIELIEPTVYDSSSDTPEEPRSVADKEIMTEPPAKVEARLTEAAEVELSPTTDEYQEGMHFSSKDIVFDYDIVEAEKHYIPPAPTPAPSMAPLAVVEVDIVDDEPFDEMAAKTLTTVLSSDEVGRRRKKRNPDIKKFSSFDERDKANERPTGGTEQLPPPPPSSSSSATGNADGPEHNAVCPWEDENVNTSDGTFVKTYATLGYL